MVRSQDSMQQSTVHHVTYSIVDVRRIGTFGRSVGFSSAHRCSNKAICRLYVKIGPLFDVVTTRFPGAPLLPGIGSAAVRAVRY